MTIKHKLPIAAAVVTFGLVLVSSLPLSAATRPDPLQNLIDVVRQIVAFIVGVDARLDSIESRLANLPANGGGLRVVDSQTQTVGLLAAPTFLGIPSTSLYVTLDGKTFVAQATPGGFAQNASFLYPTLDCSGPSYAAIAATFVLPLPPAFLYPLSGIAGTTGYYVDLSTPAIVPPPEAPFGTPQNFSQRSALNGVLGACQIPTFPPAAGGHWIQFSTVDLSRFIPPFTLQTD